MRNSKKQPKELAVVVCILVVAGIIFYQKQDRAKVSTVHVGSTPESPIDVQTPAAPVSPGSSEIKVSEGTETSQASPSVSEVIETESPIERFEKEQQKTIDQYSELAHLKMKLPTYLQYRELDFDENVAILYGQNPIGKRQLAVLATKGKVDVEKALKFVNDSQSHLPIVKGKGFQISGAPRSIAIPAGSGFKSMEIIPGQTENGLSIFAVHAERADGKGTYLFMMKDQTQVFDGDIEFDNLLDSVKAQ